MILTSDFRGIKYLCPFARDKILCKKGIVKLDLLDNALE